MMNSQQKVIAIAGGSAAIVLVGFALFLLNRKSTSEHSTDEDKDENIKDSEQELNTSVASAGQSTIEVKVPQRIVGTIIGKSGSNIKQLKQEFSVRFDFDEDEKGEKSDRILTIRGEREKVYAAERRIKRIISEAPVFVETEMFVPKEALGRIIGKGGNKIRELSNTSGAKILIGREENPALGELKRIRLTGSSMQVDYAKALIEDEVQMEKAFRAANPRQEKQTTKEGWSISTVHLPETNQYFQVFVSAVDSPDHLWIQLVNQDSVKLTTLDKNLLNTYGKLSSEEERLDSGKVGDTCIAPFDEGWHRVVVTSIDVAKRQASVLYVDYGDRAIVNIDDLKKCRAEYLEIPAQAVECYLPVNYSRDCSDDDIEMVRKLTKCAKWIPLMAKIIGHKQLNGKQFPILELVDTQNKDLNICNELVKAGIVSRGDAENEVHAEQEVEEEKADQSLTLSTSIAEGNGDEDKTPTNDVRKDIPPVQDGNHTDQKAVVSKQDSLEDFIDIEMSDLNGSVSTHLVENSPSVMVDEEDVNKSIDGLVQSEVDRDEDNTTLVNQDDNNEVEHELQRSLEETSRKNVYVNSMEMARKNPLFTSSSDGAFADSDSFVSARSDVTITDTDNASFVSAADRLTPTNDISFNIPDLPKQSSRGLHGSLHNVSPKPIGPDTKKLSGSKLEIQFIDETTHRVMSRESLDSTFDTNAFFNKNDNDKKKKAKKETTV